MKWYLAIIVFAILIITDLRIKDEKTKLNLMVITQAIIIIVGFCGTGIVVYCICKDLPIQMNYSIRIIMTALTVGIYFIIGILILKNIILDAIRIADYYINRKRAFHNGRVAKGRVIGVEEDGVGRHWSGRGTRKYRLIVDFNGKELKSIWFLDKSYSKRKTIDVITYKNGNYVALKDEKFI